MARKKFKPQKGKLSTMPQTVPTLELKAAVLKALEDERYDWRTVNGLARTLKTNEQEILRVLNSVPDQIVRTNAADGRSVFTTRNHYEKTHGFGDKLLSALADKVVA
jgi:hypothetical protein